MLAVATSTSPPRQYPVPVSPQLRRALISVAMTVSTLVAATLTPSAPARADSQPGVGITRSTSKATPAENDSVYRLYRAYFLREPDASGQSYWAGQYASGRLSLPAISEFFARSAEFSRRYGSLNDGEFVGLIYRNVLGRTADQPGETFWVQRLRGGLSRGSVMVGFSESPEFQRKTGTLPAVPAPASWVTQLLAMVNTERSRNGLAPLTLCAPLTAAAQAHSDDQARIQTMTHVGSDGSTHGTRATSAGYDWTWSGENVARGDAQFDVEDIFNAWLQSSDHRANILHPAFVHMGAARATGADGDIYWTQTFGAGGTC